MHSDTGAPVLLFNLDHRSNHVGIANCDSVIMLANDGMKKDGLTVVGDPRQFLLLGWY
jgi:hypothetical protein